MNWILNSINIVACFFIIVGTVQIIHHDIFIRYGQGAIEKVVQSNASDLATPGDIAAPGGTQYVVSFTNPSSGKKITDQWIGLRMGSKATIGENVAIQYQTDKLNRFEPSKRRYTEANARNLILVGICALLVSIIIRLWIIGRLAGGTILSS
ncbi:MAG: hypothetical protein NT027_14320 [Proteobacteria bacterium]|nr:hypothetical protein [Pseudomonadota bacterium]